LFGIYGRSKNCQRRPLKAALKKPASSSGQKYLSCGSLPKYSPGSQPLLSFQKYGEIPFG